MERNYACTSSSPRGWRAPPRPWPPTPARVARRNRNPPGLPRCRAFRRRGTGRCDRSRWRFRRPCKASAISSGIPGTARRAQRGPQRQSADQRHDFGQILAQEGLAAGQPQFAERRSGGRDALDLRRREVVRAVKLVKIEAGAAERIATRSDKQKKRVELPRAHAFLEDREILPH